MQAQPAMRQPIMQPPAPQVLAAQRLLPVGGAGVVEVRCPSCSRMTVATPGQAAVCFSCGQPVPAGAPASVGQYPLTNQMGQEALRPPSSPYGAPAAAVLSGGPGQFLVDREIKVGRDPAICAIVLHEPRVSGVHATLKFESAQLWVKDEASNNGTFIDGARLAPNVWTPVRAGALLKFGPSELNVRLE